MTEGNIEFHQFVTDETPHAMWDLDIRERNLEFLSSIDPEYFNHIAKTHAPLLNGADRQYAAMALRIAYSQGLETMFALLGALIQADGCVVGWMLKYRNYDLENLIFKIQNEKPIYSQIKTKITWSNLSEIVIPDFQDDTEHIKAVREGFARAWRRFAEDFLHVKWKTEYNSIKHGSRARIGGFTIKIGLQDDIGIPSKPEQMVQLGGSEFGSKFFSPVTVGDKNNFQLKSNSINWNPENFVHGLMLISAGIQNIISTLKAMNGISNTEVEWSVPTSNSEGIFDAPWKDRPGVILFDYGIDLSLDAAALRSSKDILAIYEIVDIKADK
jgi:pyruvoyl-dependent arginine decarboxylase (PvlArgDC)